MRCSSLPPTPEGDPGDVFAIGVFLARGTGFGGEAGETGGALIMDEGEALAIAAGVEIVVGDDGAPGGAEVFEDGVEVVQVIAEFDDADEIELADDFGDEME